MILNINLPRKFYIPFNRACRIIKRSNVINVRVPACCIFLVRRYLYRTPPSVQQHRGGDTQVSFVHIWIADHLSFRRDSLDDAHNGQAFNSDMVHPHFGFKSLSQKKLEARTQWSTEVSTHKVKLFYHCIYLIYFV